MAGGKNEHNSQLPTQNGKTTIGSQTTTQTGNATISSQSPVQSSHITTTNSVNNNHATTTASTRQAPTATIFTPTTREEVKQQAKQNKLPQTGNESGLAATILGAMGVAMSFGMLSRKRRHN